MSNNLIIWPKSEDITHINYHYTQFGEIVNYLNRTLKDKVFAIDEDINDIDIQDFIEKNEIEKIIMQVNYENASNAFRLAEQIKEKNKTPVMAYGSITVMLKKLFLNSSFDAIYDSGDYEIAISSFIKNYQKDSNSDEDLQGLKLIKDGEFVSTKKGSYISENQWGISNDKEVPIKEYDKLKGKNRYVLNVSRGCPFGCEHCLIQLTEGRKERRRSIENLKRALGLICKDYKHIKIWAANFTLNKEYVHEFCKAIKEDYPDITWECATRIDLVKDIELLKEMYDSGCKQISLGIESLNNGDLIGTKDFKVQEIETAIDNIQSQGIGVKGCIMLGMPNQTRQSIINTIAFLKRKNVTIRPTIYTPYHLINDNTNVNELSQYNRKTYENTSVKDITHKQLLELVRNPYDYETILELYKEKTWEI